MNIAYILLGARYSVRVTVQTQDGKQFYHRLYLRAQSRDKAERVAAARASRRFPGCGIQAEKPVYEGAA
jgi:hypothetical protein